MTTTAWFDSNSYYIEGPKTQVFHRYQPVVEDYLHLYYVIIAILNEVKNIDDKIIVYGDCRNIDELNGVEPLNPQGLKLKSLILRNQLPHLKGMCHFRKVQHSKLEKSIMAGAHNLLVDEDDNRKVQLAQVHLAHTAQLEKSRRASALERFKNGRKNL